MNRDMRELDLEQLRKIAADEKYPLVFATVSGAHLYGFPSYDSDVDLRGVHLLPAAEVVGLRHGPETLDRMWNDDGAEIDLVSHDLAKFLTLLLRPNGYVLEQLLSPLVVVTGDLHAELVALAPGCVTLHHAHHYRGFSHNQWKLFGSSGELKPLLYTFRVLLTGVHMMRAGEVEADLRELLARVPEAPSYLPALMHAKATQEHAGLDGVAGRPDDVRLAADVQRLHAVLDAAQESSTLPDRPSAGDALHDLLVRARLG